MNFNHCMTSLSLGGKISENELRETAETYQQRGLDGEAAMVRAVEDRLEVALMEERNIITGARQQYEAKGGKKKVAPAPQPTVTKEAENATQEISQPESVQGERGQGNRVGQAPETSGSNRVQRPEGSTEVQPARPAAVQAQQVTRLPIPPQVANFGLTERQAWDAPWNALKNLVRAGKVTDADAKQLRAIASKADAGKILGKLVTEI